MSSQGFILAENLLENGAVSASSALPAFPARNAYDGMTTTFWQPSGTGTHTLTLALSSAVAVDTFCCFKHNLAAAGGSIKLQYSPDSGSTWTDAFSALTPADDACVMKRFTPVTCDYWRVTTTIATAPLYLGAVAFGSAINTYRGVPVGWIAPADARVSESIPNTTESGAFAGRSVIPRGAQSSLQINHVPLDWIRSTWRAFIKRAEGHPFFYCWNYVSFPEETVYTQLRYPLTAPQQTEFGLYTISTAIDCLLGTGGGA